MAKGIEQSYPVRVDELTRLMLNQGMTKEALSTKSKVSTRTIRRALAGERIRIFLIRRLAGALGAQTEALVPEAFLPPKKQEQATPSASATAGYVTFKIQFPPESFDEGPMLESWLNQLAEVVHLVGSLEVEGVKEPGLRILCRLTKSEDVRRLARAFAAGELSALAVDGVELQDSRVDVTRDVAEAISLNGHHSDARNIETLIRSRPHTSVFSLILGALFSIGTSQVMPSPDDVGSTKRFDNVAGRALNVDYDFATSAIRKLEGTIPARELSEAQARIASWAGPE